MVTHDSRMIQWSDRIYRMEDGCLTEQAKSLSSKESAYAKRNIFQYFQRKTAMDLRDFIR